MKLSLKVEEEFEQIFKNIAWAMDIYVKKSGKSCLFYDYEDIRVYVNQRATYMTVKILKEEYKFSVKSLGGTTVNYDGPYNKKIELILLDAFSNTLEELQRLSGVITNDFEEELDKLFDKIIKKRKLNIDKSPKNFEQKVYI
jgi:hypothetical protein